MDIRAIVGAVLVIGGAVGCAHSPPPVREAFNCTRVSELGELELSNGQCGELRRGEIQTVDRSTLIAEPASSHVDRIRPTMGIDEVREARARVIAPRPEIFRPRPMRPPPPPKR